MAGESPLFTFSVVFPWLVVVVLAPSVAILRMFTAFQSALRDVFLVTVQKEEELTCATAAIALGTSTPHLKAVHVSIFMH